MAFRYKVRRPPREPMAFFKPQRTGDTETLSGFVNGYKASDIEERFARALSKNELVNGFVFREPVISARSRPGQLEIDFVVQSGPIVYAFQIDGEYAHKGIGKRMDDARKDELVNQFMKRYGAKPVMRIDGEKLSTQEDADRLVRELI